MKKKKTLTAREVREGRMLGRLPLFVAPLLVVVFWISGGGKGVAAKMATGFEMRLPGPHVGQVTRLDKMG
jgi:hypothetical protein